MKRNYIIIASIIGTLVAVGFIVWLFVRPSGDSSNTNTSSNTNQNATNIAQTQAYIFVFGVEPHTGAAAGGESVTIRGAGFIAGARVLFNDVEARDVQMTDERTITAKTPAGTGTVSVKIINPDGRSGILYEAYTYN